MKTLSFVLWRLLVNLWEDLILLWFFVIMAIIVLVFVLLVIKYGEVIIGWTFGSVVLFAILSKPISSTINDYKSYKLAKKYGHDTDDLW